MVNTGTVVQSSAGMLTIIFDRPEACGECHACNRGSESCAKHTLVIPGKGEIGQKVEVEIDDQHVVLASALAYCIPLMGLIVGLAAGWLLGRAFPPFQSEPMIALIGVLGVVLGYIIMKALNPIFAKTRWQPKIRAISAD